MSKSYPESSSALGNIEPQQIIETLNIDANNLLKAASDANILNKILKEIIVRKEMERCNEFKLTRLEWREKMFGDRVEELFIEKRSGLEKVSFWYLMINNKAEAMETYYQLCNNEISFEDLKLQNAATRYFNDKLLSELDSSICLALKKGKIKIPIKPVRTKKGYLLLQKELINIIQLDDKLRSIILRELEQAWYLRELDRLFDN